MNKLAAKSLELEKAQHEIELLRDFQNESTVENTNDEDQTQIALELDIVRAEKASLSEEVCFTCVLIFFYLVDCIEQ